jgi:hypothetical protein
MFRSLRSNIAALTLAAGVVATATAAAPAPASAQEFGPAFRVAQADLTYRLPHHMRAFVLGFDRFNMTVGVHGNPIPVQLHQGTVILPTGLTIEPHMLVRVDGYWAYGAFQADRIVLVR